MRDDRVRGAAEKDGSRRPIERRAQTRRGGSLAIGLILAATTVATGGWQLFQQPEGSRVALDHQPEPASLLIEPATADRAVAQFDDPPMADEGPFRLTSAETREDALLARLGVDDSEALIEFGRSLTDPDLWVRDAAQTGIYRFPDRRAALNLLRGMLESTARAERAAAADLLDEMGETDLPWDELARGPLSDASDSSGR